MSGPAEDHRWEWTLPSGVRMAATVDPAERVESVYVGGRLVSQAPRGSRPEGHVLTDPSGVVVTFQRGALICILRVDGEEVPPARWPVRKRAERPKPRVMSFPVGVVGAVVLALAAAAGAFVLLRDRSPRGEGTAAMAGTHRAENGRFVAHYPASFVARRAVVPSGMSGVVLEDAERKDAIVLLALATGDVPREPWLAQKKLHDEGLANLPRGSSGYEERVRSDEACVGERGAVVRGRVKNTRGETAEVWSCAFLHEGAAYLAMFALRENATSEDEKRLRAIVEETELTTLAEIRVDRP